MKIRALAMGATVAAAAFAAGLMPGMSAAYAATTDNMPATMSAIHGGDFMNSMSSDTMWRMGASDHGAFNLDQPARLRDDGPSGFSDDSWFGRDDFGNTCDRWDRDMRFRNFDDRFCGFRHFRDFDDRDRFRDFDNRGMHWGW